MMIAKGLRSPRPAAAPTPPPSGAELTLLATVQLPLDGAVRVKFGDRVPLVHMPYDKCLYTVGGEVTQETNPGYLNGSPTLWKYNPATTTLTKVKPYWATSGSVPSHPHGAMLVQDPEYALAGICIVPGTTGDPATYGGWGGASTPVQNSVMRYQMSTDSWVTLFTKQANWPSTHSNAGMGNINGTFAYAIGQSGGVATLHSQQMSGPYTTRVLGAGYEAVDPGITQQVLIMGYGQDAITCACFDYATGRIIGQYVFAAGTFVIASGLPTMASSTYPFAMVYDPRRHKLLCCIEGEFYVTDLNTGVSTYEGAAPQQFTTGCYDPKSDLIVLAGAPSGSDYIYHYALADREQPLTLDAHEWQERDFTQGLFHYEFKWSWKNLGGDWKDSAGTSQGGAYFDIQTLSGVGWKTWGATTLAQAWQANTNTGALFLSYGDTKFYSRHATDATKRPYLLVNTATQTGLVCPSVAGAVITGGTPQDVTDTLYGAPGTPPIAFAIRFDLSAVVGSITFASINLYAYAQVSGVSTVYRLDHPAIVEAGTGTTDGTGIAAGYSRDIGLDAHASVYVADDWSSGFAARVLPRTAPGSAVVEQQVSVSYDAAQAETWARYEFFSNSRTATNFRIFLTDHGGSYRDEIFLRIRLKIDDDFDPHVDGGKLAAALDFRMANLAGCGNGGSSSTGYREADVGALPQYCGGSMRMNFRRVPTVGPYTNCVIPFLYIYRPGITGFGDPIPVGSAANGYHCFLPGVDYDIEIHGLMNTVDVSAPDALGNGVGNADGALRMWINDVKVYEQANIILRHHPNIKFMGWWHDTTHGGTTNVQTEHHYEVGKWAMASQRIGRMVKV